jgi:hypothetical protein
VRLGLDCSFWRLLSLISAAHQDLTAWIASRALEQSDGVQIPFSSL